MRRCIQLALLARNEVAPNPMVGAVLVYQDRVIGEGYHQQYGQAHAEVACLVSVAKDNQSLIPQSTLYVSLEPCAHWGKTPPCADLIIEKKIPAVVVGCRDPFEEVNGKGIEKLRAAGVQVETGVLEKECKDLNKRFFTYHLYGRPYVTLKWAQTEDGKIGVKGERLKISSEFTNRLVHQWRSEETAILVGTTTALNDNPQLNTRLWPGKNPVRVVLDRTLRLPSSLHIFDGTAPTIIFNIHQHTLPTEKVDVRSLEGVYYYQIKNEGSAVAQLLHGLYSLGIQSVLVEGGAQLLQAFIDKEFWDEARVITAERMVIGEGVPAPQLSNHTLLQSHTISTDVVRHYQRLHS